MHEQELLFAAVLASKCGHCIRPANAFGISGGAQVARRRPLHAVLARRHSKQTCVAVCRRARLAVTTLSHTAGTTTAGLCLRHTRWKRAAPLASQGRGRLLAPRR